MTHCMPPATIRTVAAGRGRIASLMLSLAAIASSAACAQTAPVAEPPVQATEAAKPFVPQVGQAGKDVIWVPTPDELVQRMLDLAKATPNDYLIDLGSGDGRTVIAAAKRGLRAHGIEYNPKMVELARQNAKEAGVSERATFEEADIFKADFTKAQIISMFLLPTLNERLRPQLLDMAPGTRIVTNAFRIGDWEPDETVQVAECKGAWCTAHLWIVPAKVEGNWKLGGQTLALKQTYQKLSGSLGDTAITDATMNGNRISFKAGDVSYSGNVNGAAMSGTTSGGKSGEWSAARS